LKSQFIPKAYPNPMPPKPRAQSPKPAWADLRLTDRVEPGVRVLLIGINPGVRSAETGHHFAGPSNRFWKLLYAAGVVPEPITHEGDVRLPEWGLGVTNLIARPSPGIDDLKPAEYLEGWQILERKIDRFRPDIVAFVGVTMYRALWKVIGHAEPPAVAPGFQKATVHGARLFVLPNPSGRNAHFSWDDMLDAFRGLARAIKRLPPRDASGRPLPLPSTAASSSAGSTAAATGRSRRAAGRAPRTTPSSPAAAPTRTATRKRAGSRS
jgi:TDG/mug DNA glycosylase family protein